MRDRSTPTHDEHGAKNKPSASHVVSAQSSTPFSILASADISQPLSAEAILQMQQSHGNRYVQRMIAKRQTTPVVQRFESPEHVQLGDASGGVQTGFITLDAHNRDLPFRQQPVNTWPQEWQDIYNASNAQQQRAMTQGLTYGEMVALSGDMYRTFQELNNAPMREIIRLIPLIRSASTTTSQFQEATGGRYLALAADNETHFTNSDHNNLSTWRSQHIAAIQAARSGNANLAYGMNAAADHFLTDAFSGGHIRVARSQLHREGSTGDAQSKILHDYDNENGVTVDNARHDGPWIAYGDNFLNDPRNAMDRRLAEEAVRMSKQDIANALAQGMAYPVPGPTTPFDAERLVPQLVGDGGSRGTAGVIGTTLSVIGSEVPGLIAGLFNDDDQIRAWVASQDVTGIRAQPPEQKIRMINTLLNGWVSDEDLDAVERICGAAANRSEMDAIRAAISPRATELTSFGQRTRLRVILGRNP